MEMKLRAKSRGLPLSVELHNNSEPESYPVKVFCMIDLFGRLY